MGEMADEMRDRRVEEAIEEEIWNVIAQTYSPTHAVYCYSCTSW